MRHTATLATAVINAYIDHDLARFEELQAPAARISFANVVGDISLGSWLTSLERLFSALPDLAARPVKMLADESKAIVEIHQIGNWPKHWFHECLGLLTVAATPNDHRNSAPSLAAPPHGG